MDIVKDKSEENLNADTLAEILKRAGENAKKKAFENNLPIPVLMNDEIYYLFADGHIEKKENSAYSEK